MSLTLIGKTSLVTSSRPVTGGIVEARRPEWVEEIVTMGDFRLSGAKVATIETMLSDSGAHAGVLASI